MKTIFEITGQKLSKEAQSKITGGNFFLNQNCEEVKVCIKWNDNLTECEVEAIQIRCDQD